MLDVDGTLSLANDSALKTFGLGRTDLGRSFREIPLASGLSALRRAVSAALAAGEPAEVLAVESGEGDSRLVHDVHVVPLTADDGSTLGAQVTFLDVTRFSLLQEQLVLAQRELETAYEELQSANEELETTNEELQSAVEELETTNEELQSTNEELETMNEELQSTNEELQTLNDELRDRTGEVNQVNAFLESVLMSLQGAVVVVDRDLVVRVWNERAERMWGLRAYEAQGRSLFALDVGLPADLLRGLVGDVLNGGRQHAQTVVPARDRFGRDISCAVSCSALLDVTGATDGALLLMEERRDDPAVAVSPATG